MKLLFLAPQPFYQERGTPIAVKLALEVLVEALPIIVNGRVRIDLLTYHEGMPTDMDGINHVRIHTPLGSHKFLRGVGAGISSKKLLCDLLFLFSTFALVWKNRSEPYTLIHAVEESVFIALLVKWFFGVPYIYDMDSSLALQVTEKWWALRPIAPILRWAERLAIKHSIAVAPVCDSLAQIADAHGSAYTRVLRDISLLNLNSPARAATLKQELGLAEQAKLLLYVGNLEHYQGIDLLLDGFAEAAKEIPDLHLVIIGGAPAHVMLYTERANNLGVSSQAHLVGPRPIDELDCYLLEADFVISPRTKGNNTPMKIYSYLHSGKPILATALWTHTQVLDDSTAELFEATSEALANAVRILWNSPERQKSLGMRAKAIAEERYTRSAFVSELEGLYRVVLGQMAETAAPGGELRSVTP